jgi:hypothetical protein
VYYTWNNGHVGWGPRGPHDRPGQTPVNLPHGTVTTGGGAIGPGGRGGRVTREELGGAGTGMRFGFSQPEGFGGAVRSAGLAPRSPRDGGRQGLRGDMPPASGEGAVNGAPAVRYSGSMPTPRTVPAEQRADTSRGGRNPRAEAPVGIVYDPNSGRYINGAPITSRPAIDGSVSAGSAGAVGAPSGNSTPPQPSAGFSGRRDDGNDRGGKPGQPVPPGIDRRNGDDTPAPRNAQPAPAAQPSAGYSGRRDDGNDRGGKPGQPVAPGIDRRNGDDSPRPSATSSGRNNPRVDSPRNDGGYSGARPAPAPPPRVESPRPSSPPPRPPSNGNKPTGNSFRSGSSSGGSSSGSRGSWGSRPSGSSSGSSRPSNGRPH